MTSSVVVCHLKKKDFTSRMNKIFYKVFSKVVRQNKEFLMPINLIYLVLRWRSYV